MTRPSLRLGVEFLLLAALWGASFLFMRIGAPEFGPVPMMALRVAIAALCLLPVLLLRHGGGALRARLLSLSLFGLFNSAIPFVLFAFATLHLSAGFTSILNATAPFWAALVGWLWIRERIDLPRALGLGIGFAGVVLLVWGRLAPQGGAVPASATATATATETATATAIGASGGAATNALLGIGACLAATLCYGIAATYTRSRLRGVDSLTASTGSMIGATIALAPFAWWYWPARMPGTGAWLSVGVLGAFGTGLAYILYFRLIGALGASGGVTVTFLIPVFGMLWGALFLAETVTANMVAGTALILAGTALTTGLVKWSASSGRRGWG